MDEKEILKIALKNAIDHEGKASEGAVLSKVIGQDKSVLKDMAAIKSKISKIVLDINSKDLEDLTDLADEVGLDLSKEKPVEPKLELKALPNVKGKITLRIPPEPSGYMHLGHGISFMINYLYKEKYGGKIWLRYEDTNPKLLKNIAEYIESFETGLDWLGIKWDEKKFITSDMELLYSYGEKLLKESKAYVCLCTFDEIKEKRVTGEACKHRTQSFETNLKLWNSAKKGEFDDGQVIIRFKGDMKSNDLALRDPSIFRVIKNDYKPYSLWPIYDFASVVEDHVCGITHILRSNEFKVNVQDKLRDALELNKPTVVQYGRFNFKGTPFSKRKIRALIKEGSISGWDDLRLPTIPAIKRRGIQPEALKEFVLTVGYTNSQHEYSWDLLFTLNRRLIDTKAKRFFFVSEPASLYVKGAVPTEAKLRSHPAQDLGFRLIKTNENFFIEKKDLEAISIGETVRLKDLYNITITKKSENGAEAELSKSKLLGEEKIIHWVTNENIKAKVTVLGTILNDDETFNKDSLKTLNGVGERAIGLIKPGEIVQFERFGFCRLDKIGKEPEFIFISR